MATACDNPDYELLVTNDTPHTVLVRVRLGGPYAGKYNVHKFEPGADRVGNVWWGDADASIEALDAQCQRLGVFVRSPNGALVVEGIDGLVAQVEAYGTARSNSSAPVEDCGGMVLR